MSRENSISSGNWEPVPYFDRYYSTIFSSATGYLVPILTDTYVSKILRRKSKMIFSSPFL
jgi:hypothetical protein